MTDKTIDNNEDEDDNFPKTDFDDLLKRGEEQAKKEVINLMSGNAVEITTEMLQRTALGLPEMRTTLNSKASGVMTESLAKFIRILRKANFTWRSIAQEVNDKLDGDWGSNQIMGIALCEAAAKVLGEDCNAEPWN